MGASDKMFTIKLESKDVKNGKVPLSLFVKTVNSIQKTMYALGNSRLKGEPASPGRKPSIIEKECELFLLKAEPGSLSAQLALPEKEPDLAEGVPSFGENVLQDFKIVLSSFATNDPIAFKSVVPDPKCQKQIYSNVVGLLPSEKDDYEFYFSFHADRPLQRAHRPSTDAIGMYVEEVKDDISISEDVEKFIAIVLGTVDQETGKQLDIKEVIDYERMDDLRPYRAGEVNYANRSLLLSREIACSVTKEDGYILIQYEPLGIKAYAESREQAIDEFKEEFLMIWDTYSNESDDNLTQDAIELKQKIKGLVEGEQLIGNFKNVKN